MSYDRWERPWSEREEYEARPQRTRIVREVRTSDFFWLMLFLFMLFLLAVGLTINGFSILADVIQHDVLQNAKHTKFTISDINWAMLKVICGPLLGAGVAWLLVRVVRDWCFTLTAPADTIYIKRRW